MRRALMLSQPTSLKVLTDHAYTAGGNLMKGYTESKSQCKQKTSL